MPFPTTAAMANALGPALVGFVFGGPSPAFIVLAVAVVALLVAWLVLGGLAGAWLDLALVGEVADEGLAGIDRPSGGGAWRALGVRAIAHLPTVAVIAWGATRFVDQAYQELIHPGDPTIPVVVRVILRVPDIVAWLVAAWIAGETIGGLAVRHLAWGASVPRALGRACVSLIRPAALAVLVLTDAVLVAGIAVGFGAIAVAWGAARVALVDGASSLVTALALALLSAAWLVALWLIGLAAAWRSAAWTMEVGRRRPRTIEPPTA